MKAQLTPIAAAAALFLLHAAAVAQTAPQPAAAATAPAAASDDKIERVEVIGIRGSMQRSLQVKRDADTHVEVITAEDVGKMPDKNVADSLQRVAGVTISSAGANEGGFDENDRVSMRGTNPSLTQTMINGHAVSSGDWFVLNQTGTVGRSVSYSLLPSELVGQVVIHKSAQASDIEGGVVGTVNILTRKPLDFRNPLTLEGNVGVVYADLPEKTDPQLSALLNWKNESNTFGILAQAFSEKRHLRRDGQELLGYEQIAAGSAVANLHPDLAGVWYPTMIGAALFEQERTRTGGLIDVQLKPSKDLMLDLTGFASKMDAPNYNRNYLLWNTHFINKGAGQSPDDGYVVRNGTLVGASFAPVAGTQYGVYDQISRPDSKADSSFVNFDAKVRATENLTFLTKIGTTRGTGETPTQDVAEWNTGAGSGGSWGLHGTDRAADWSLGNANNASPAGVPLGWIFGDQFVKVRDKEDWFQFDGELNLDAGMLSGVKFGVRNARHSRESHGVVGQGPACKDSSGNTVAFDWSQQYFCPAGTQSPFDPANFPSGGYSQYPNNFGGGLSGTFPRNVWFYSPAQLAAYNEKFTNRAKDGSREDWNSEYGLTERSNAVFVQGDLSGDGWSGNVGMRLVQTRERILNNTAVSAATPGAITTSAFGPFLPVVTEHTYSDALPSANLRVNLNKDLVARFSASRTMTRPDYSALAGVVSLSPPAAEGVNGSGSGGNPDLKPVRSNNFDATLEWYFAPRSLLSVGAFYMDLASYIGYGRVSKEFLTFSNLHPEGQLDTYDLTVPVNTKGKASGLEIAYEQPVTSNISVTANYTYVDAHESGGKPLVGASKNSYSLGGSYENDYLSARVNYSFRSKFYSGLDRSTAFSQDDVGNLSATFGYKINDTFSISLDGRNLNNPKLKYFALNEDQPRSIYENGRQYYLTLRVKM